MKGNNIFCKVTFMMNPAGWAGEHWLAGEYGESAHELVGLAPVLHLLQIHKTSYFIVLKKMLPSPRT